MTLSAKERFRETPAARQWRATVESFWFHEGLTAALAHMIMNATPTGNDASAAAAAFNRMEGAKAMVQTILTLADPPAPKSTPPEQNLKPV